MQFSNTISHQESGLSSHCYEEFQWWEFLPQCILHLVVFWTMVLSLHKPPGIGLHICVKWASFSYLWYSKAFNEPWRGLLQDEISCTAMVEKPKSLLVKVIMSHPEKNCSDPGTTDGAPHPREWWRQRLLYSPHWKVFLNCSSVTQSQR